MSVLFRHNRLHVGYRLKDWSDVWYEPFKPEKGEYEYDEDGGALVLLYKGDRVAAGYRDPFASEVAWHPFFDPKWCEATKPKEKCEMQKQFLADAHKYFMEKDPERLRQLEEELEQEGFSRWQTFFKLAKKVSRTKVTRRAKRTKFARDANVPEQEIQVNSDTSGDSAYESEGEVMRKRGTMPPPRTKKQNGKRPAANNPPKESKQTSKRARPSPRRSSLSLSDRKNPASTVMSGGLMRGAIELGGVRQSPFILGSYSERSADSDNEDDDDQSPIFVTPGQDQDMPPPSGQSRIGGLGGWNFNDLLTPQTQQELSSRNARKDSHERTSSRTDVARKWDGDGDQQGRNGVGENGGQLPRIGLDDDEQLDRVEYERQQAVVKHNGVDIDEDEALREAVRRSSQAPEERSGLFVHPAESIRDSIEGETEQ